MSTPPGPIRGLRADARRNHERILDATRAAIAESGAGFAVDDVATRAGVAVATLYRRFDGRSGLIRAVTDRFVDDEIVPLIAVAVDDPDPWRALVHGMEAAAVAVSADTPLLEVARDTGVIAEAVAARFLDPLAGALRRAQDAGMARPDLTPDDLSALIAMVVTTMVQSPDRQTMWSWRRYLALLLDGSRAHPAHEPLPPHQPGTRSPLG